MTIISHTHQFIYIKARKVASSSLLVALGQHCQAPDIVTAPGDTEGHEHVLLNDQNVETHTPPSEIKTMMTTEQWEQYTKITCVRNPWDVAVSMLFWRLYITEKRPARGLRVSPKIRESIIKHDVDLSDAYFRQQFKDIIRSTGRNERFYFDPNGRPYADIYLRYENLQADFDQACSDLGLPQTMLPNLKSASREKDSTYTAFYDDELRELVYNTNKKTIDHFGYTF